MESKGRGVLDTRMRGYDELVWGGESNPVVASEAKRTPHSPTRLLATSIRYSPLTIRTLLLHPFHHLDRPRHRILCR
jgi:hypothetical protein